MLIDYPIFRSLWFRYSARGIKSFRVQNTSRDRGSDIAGELMTNLLEDFKGNYFQISSWYDRHLSMRSEREELKSKALESWVFATPSNTFWNIWIYLRYLARGAAKSLYLSPFQSHFKDRLLREILVIFREHKSDKLRESSGNAFGSLHGITPRSIYFNNLLEYTYQWSFPIGYRLMVFALLSSIKWKHSFEKNDQLLFLYIAVDRFWNVLSHLIDFF